ncbi:MAG: hypothetical protein HOV79_06485 [Hamadaea sp.]|nr:hypothetical protein [Hamadaea sp.]
MTTRQGPGAVKAAPGPFVVAVVLLVAGLALFAQALSAGSERGVTLGGPTLVPIIVTGLWSAVALIHLFSVVRAALRPASTGPAAAPEDADVEPGKGRWLSPILLLAALIAYAVILKYTVVGYVLATSAFFFASARILGGLRAPARIVLRDLAIAVALALAIYLGFTRLLGIVLPAGVLPL